MGLLIIGVLPNALLYVVGTSDRIYLRCAAVYGVTNNLRSANAQLISICCSVVVDPFVEAVGGADFGGDGD